MTFKVKKKQLLFVNRV